MRVRLSFECLKFLFVTHRRYRSICKKRKGKAQMCCPTQFPPGV